jgi:alkanesulfonate monooxygenase
MEAHMPVEFIGWIDTQESSEISLRPGPLVDAGYLRDIAGAHEEADFDRVLIGWFSSRPDGLQVAAQAAATTDRLGMLIAHRPGFIAPTLAARMFATLDQFTGGRVALHTISGSSDVEQRRDGDYLTKDQRYARTDEYLDIVRMTWTRDEPFSYDGEYYKLEDGFSSVKPTQEPHIPIFFGGSSEAAYRVGAKHADVFMLWGEPLAETAEQIASVRAHADPIGARPEFSVSFRPILAPTDELAWERAHDILAKIEAGGSRALLQKMMPGGVAPGPANAGSQRLLAAAEKADHHDRALWTATAKATGAGGNSTALVGSPGTVAAAILDYIDLGVTRILVRGFEPLKDAIAFGQHLIPLVRDEVRRREAAGADTRVA